MAMPRFELVGAILCRKKIGQARTGKNRRPINEQTARHQSMTNQPAEEGLLMV
jgi:hypothetical protein